MKELVCLATNLRILVRDSQRTALKVFHPPSYVGEAREVQYGNQGVTFGPVSKGDWFSTADSKASATVVSAEITRSLRPELYGNIPVKEGYLV